MALARSWARRCPSWDRRGGRTGAAPPPDRSLPQTSTRPRTRRYSSLYARASSPPPATCAGPGRRSARGTTVAWFRAITAKSTGPCLGTIPLPHWKRGRRSTRRARPRQRQRPGGRARQPAARSPCAPCRPPPADHERRREADEERLPRAGDSVPGLVAGHDVVVVANAATTRRPPRARAGTAGRARSPRRQYRRPRNRPCSEAKAPRLEARASQKYRLRLPVAQGRAVWMIHLITSCGVAARNAAPQKAAALPPPWAGRRYGGAAQAARAATRPSTAATTRTRPAIGSSCHTRPPASPHRAHCRVRSKGRRLSQYQRNRETPNDVRAWE